MQTNQNMCQEDEIDLRELFLTLKKNKKVIFITIALTMLIAVIYVLLKNPTPLYQGSMMVEIGEVQNNSLNKTYLDNAYVLKNIIEKKYQATVKIPKHTKSIVIVNVQDINNKKIINKLQIIFKYIISRDEEKSKLYDKYIMTKQVGNIDISKTPVNLPKKKLILAVAFVTGLILSVFLVFFLEFLKSMKNGEESESIEKL